MIKAYFAILLMFVAVLTAIAAEGTDTMEQPSSDYTVHKGLVYSKADSGLTLDLFIPNDVQKPVPCIMVIKGGGFKAQDGQPFRPFAEEFAKQGFAAALIAYRGRPDHTYRSTMADVRNSVRFVRKESKKYGIDPERIGAMGRSAGATLTALLAVGSGVEELEDGAEHTAFPSHIQAAAGIAGVYDFVVRFTDEVQKGMQPKLEAKIQTNGEWIGSAFSPTDEHWLRCSAANHVDAGDPPFLLLHSKDDPVVPWLQTRDMQAALKRVGVNVETEYSEEGGHGGPANSKVLMVDFFKRVLMK